MNIDQARESFAKHIVKWKTEATSIETEQDARFRIINVLLTDVLGWDPSNIKTEPHSETGFTDYLFHQGGRNWMVLEAKRTSTVLIDTKNPNTSSYKLSGPALESAQSGIKQAKGYCIDHGVQFAGLTNGFQWIAFYATRTDGTPPGEGKAIVFPSLEEIEGSFAMFYDLFSKEGALQHRYLTCMNKVEGISAHPAERLVSAVPLTEIVKIQRSKLAADLILVFKQFFSEMTGDNDSEMMAKCFVQSKESKEADESLYKIVSHLTSSIEVVDSKEGEELKRHLQTAVDTQKGEFVLIVGNKGAGKSTFIDRFFQLVLSRAEREKCVVIRIDLADSTGDRTSLAAWLTAKLKVEIEKSLFDKGTPHFNELKGMFIADYERWRHGELKYLYESDPTQFNIKFGEYIAELVTKRPYDYVLAVLRNAVLSRRLMPCLVFDNTDHFPQEFQEAVFQFAQALHREVLSFVICPITDRTIWRLSKEGPFQSYTSHVFYLPAPSPKDVLEKRILYVRAKIIESEQSGDSYFLSRGIRVTIKDLIGFAQSLDEIFINIDFVGRLLGGLANFDIRRVLHLAHRVISSPQISIESLVNSYISGSTVSVKSDTIHMAIFKGDYTFFNQSDSAMVMNVFAVKPDQISSPLAKLSILRLLIDRDNAEVNTEQKYMEIEDLQKYFLPMGIGHINVLKLVEELFEYRLVEAYDPSSTHMDEEQRVKISASGRTHTELSLHNAIYMSSMASTTGVRNIEVAKDIRDWLNVRPIPNWPLLINSFVTYCMREDECFIELPPSEDYDGQRILRAELKGRWSVHRSPLNQR